MKGIGYLSRAGLLSVLLSFALTSGMATPQIELDGRQVALSVPPTQVSGKIMVPMREVFAFLGAEVRWNAATNTVTATKGNNSMQLTIGSSSGIVNGRTVPLDVPLTVLNGTAMMPLRFITDALGAKVSWSEATQIISITTGQQSTSGSPSVSPESMQAVVLPAGTVIPVSLDKDLSSATNHVGDPFTATVRSTQDGDAEFPRGTQMGGILSEVQQAGSGQPGMINLSFRGVLLPDGRKMSVAGSLIALDPKSVTQTPDGRLTAKKKSSGNDTLKFIAIGTGAGFLIGKLVDRTVLGTLLGAAGGYFYSESQKKKTQTRNVKVAQGTEFGVRLDRDLCYNASNSFVLARDNCRDQRKLPASSPK